MQISGKVCGEVAGKKFGKLGAHPKVCPTLTPSNKTHRGVLKCISQINSYRTGTFPVWGKNFDPPQTYEKQTLWDFKEKDK